MRYKQGPSPKEYVLAGLASCTSMTIRIYADNMFSAGGPGWISGSLDTVHVRAEVRIELNGII